MPRLAKPTALRVLEGDRSHRPPNKAEPKPAIRADVPRPPSHLDRKAAATWRRLAPEIHRLGLLTVVDLDLFEAYCQADAVRRAYEPGSARWDAAVARMLAISKRFGFTPSDRAGIHAPKPSDGEKKRILSPVVHGR